MSENEMKKSQREPGRPYGRDVVLVQDARRGAYWQAEHGIVVRLAAPEPGMDSEAKVRAAEHAALRAAHPATRWAT